MKKKDGDGHEFVRCSLVGWGFKPKREGPREDMFAAMPPLEAKNVLFAMVAGQMGQVKEKRAGG